MEGLVSNHVEIPVDIQNMENVQDMRFPQDLKIFKALEANIIYSIL